ncbi:MAG: metallophosphoesterase [Deltaproteobacteria bacterium]|nr:metallophosphoesterase [Deltaproteobacteria bacterium]
MMTASRTIVIGDVHGCLEELDELLRLLSVRSSDRLVFVGDLLDRGPDPIGVLRRVRELGADCVLGNHEERHLRYARHEARRTIDPRYRNPMRPFPPKELAEHRSLSKDDLAWMARLPVLLEVMPGWIVVHGGLEPGRSLSEQIPTRVIRLRYVDAAGRFVASDDPSRPPPGARPWATVWKGPYHVIYGHEVHDLSSPRVDRNEKTHAECWGIDTGCCYGGKLTALILPTREIAQVQAKAAYVQAPESFRASPHPSQAQAFSRVSRHAR